MNQTIRSRIEQIKRGEIPEGYEKTPFGIFPCDWEKDKPFKDLFIFVGGLGKSRKELGANGICYLHYGDMHTENFTKVSYAQYLEKPKYEIIINGDENFLMKDGDIAFLDASEDLEGTSRAVLIDNPENKPFIAGLHTILAKERRNVLSKNYKQYISAPQYVRKQFQRLAVGFKVYGLNRESFDKVRMAYPKLKREQEKIAEILQEQDHLIELEEKLIKEYKKLKKLLLNKMFPPKGCNYPEIRFPEFTAPWEQRKLGNVVEITMGQSPDGSTYCDTPAEYILVQGNADLKDGWVFPRVWTTQKTKTAEAGDLIMSVRAPAGAMGKTAYNVVLGRGVAAIKGNEFIFQTLVKMDFDGYWKKLAAGSTFESINSDIVSNAVILIPQQDDEQSKIGDFFESIDNLITLYQHKLDKMKNYKKVLMQLLLTGIVRVKT